jgi:UDP-glucose 4-epimerase
MASGAESGAHGASPDETGSSLRAQRSERPGRSVAVTGASTFLGRRLVGMLEEDPAVRRIVVLDVKSSPAAGPKTVYYEIDLTQPGVESRLSEILHAESVDTLAHLAFASSPTQATAWAHELESVGTMNVLAACRRKPIRKLVVSSTVLVYGPHPDNPNFINEKRATRGLHGSDFIADKLDVEAQVRRFASESPSCCVSVLRFATILGPTVDNYVARWLSRRLVPTVMGHDPLVQLAHEADAAAALKLAVDRDAPGVFNIASRGVVPVSSLVKLAGRVAFPIPYGMYRRLAGLFWVAQLSEAPPSFVAALRYLCVVDGAEAATKLGFRPRYSTQDAVLDFEGALRVREARLLHEGA